MLLECHVLTSTQHVYEKITPPYMCNLRIRYMDHSGNTKYWCSDVSTQGGVRVAGISLANLEDCNAGRTTISEQTLHEHHVSGDPHPQSIVVFCPVQWLDKSGRCYICWTPRLARHSNAVCVSMLPFVACLKYVASHHHKLHGYAPLQGIIIAEIPVKKALSSLRSWRHRLHVFCIG